jgi:polyhydroxybutyrate depolymerase
MKPLLLCLPCLPVILWLATVPASISRPVAASEMPVVAQRPVAPNSATGWQESSLPLNQTTRYFRYYVPRNLPNNAPVVMVFHGGYQSMRKIFGPNAGGTQAWPELAEAEKFLLVVPNGVNLQTGDTQGDRQSWNDCRKSDAGTGANALADDVGLTRQLITWATSNYRVDPQRVYATGASNGGMLTYRLAAELGDKIAAGAAFIANLPADSECRPLTRPVPMMIVNGTADPIMPWNGGNIAGERGRVLSAEQTVQYFLGGPSALPPQRRPVPDLNRRDNSMVTILFYPATARHPEVSFYRVDGGGHTMPSMRYPIPPLFQRRLVGTQNQDMEGARAAWRFLSRHRLGR